MSFFFWHTLYICKMNNNMTYILISILVYVSKLYNLNKRKVKFLMIILMTFTQTLDK